MALSVKVLLIVIDAASPRVVVPAITTGQLPVMKRLAAAGALHDSTVTIFPSITPAATASIITGAYPAASGIAGASWYEPGGQVVYYGDDFWVVAREGFRAFLRDFLVRLNGDRLTSPTLFETVERHGRVAGCLNYLVFKGIHQHRAHIPLLLELLPGVPASDTINGPSVFCLGDFASTRTLAGKPLNPDRDGLLHRFGMDDAASGELLCELFAEGRWPDLTVAYFADNDYRSHEVGPHAALPTIERVDAMLGRAFEAAGGMDRVLADTYVLITSDHGHCEVLADGERSAIRLHETLAAFPQARLDQPWGGNDSIRICPNMRAAQIYLREPQPLLLQQVISSLVSEPRIDHVISRTPESRQSGRGYTINSGRGSLEFWEGHQAFDSARDQFGQEWSWRGDLSVVDAVAQSGRLEWSSYPNAFERLAGALNHPQSGALWITAQPGCEFEVEGGRAHVGGGSHGALHTLESVSPFIIAGPRRIRLPQHFRSVDIAPLCLQLLELPSRYEVGEPRNSSPFT